MKIKQLPAFLVLCITVVASCKKSGTENLTPEPSAPTITGFTPLIGREGTEVIITGTNFSTNASENIIKFNGVATVATQATTNQLTVIVPTGASTGKITLTKTNQTVTSAEPFTVKPTVKKYLSKISTSHINSDDIHLIYEWQYDGMKRVTEVSSSRQIPDVLPVSKVRFHYSGNETLPHFIESLPQIGSENIAVDAYVTYGTDGKKIKDSAILKYPPCLRSLALANYSYSSTHIYADYTTKTIADNCNPGTPLEPPKLYSDTIFLGAGNVVKAAQGLLKRVVSYTHDDRINPFQQLNIFSSFYTMGFDVGFNYWLPWMSQNDNLYILGLNKNNITTIHIPAVSFSQEYAYTYDSDDYPTSAIITSNDFNKIIVVKVKYEYIE